MNKLHHFFLKMFYIHPTEKREQMLRDIIVLLCGIYALVMFKSPNMQQKMGYITFVYNKTYYLYYICFNLNRILITEQYNNLIH
ncbi:hypothetical protein [Plasmodium yoelii yoelii]|uniref:Uncharacterized protein n=1 Tax=Plasmodium yoelii yoelii TaxID=73239 RepID=Q7R8K5_PLAYO|nr:hypothetical protein [Plasmodium yoelii yoelii]